MIARTIKPSDLVRIGSVGVDSGQLLLIDPCYIDSQWQREEFKDVRRYRHKTSGEVLQYQVDFPHYEASIPKHGKTMNELIATGEWEKMPMPFPEHELSYYAVSRVTIESEKLGGNVGMLATAFSTGYGDGYYDVYARYGKDGRIMQVVVDFEN